MANQCEHIELSTDDPGKAVSFYSKIFGWQIAPTPTPDGQGVYNMFRTGNGGGGIGGKMSPHQPTAWMPYITVESIKATQAAAKALGARPIENYEYVSMGDMGAIGGFIDPTGAAIGLWEMGAAAKKAAAAAKKAAAPAKKAAAPKKATAPAKKAAPAKKLAAKKVAKKAPGKKAAKKKKR